MEKTVQCEPDEDMAAGELPVPQISRLVLNVEGQEKTMEDSRFLLS
jgi:hypothetical protein